MSTNFTINAKSREDTGKGASRRLRRLTNEVPAIIYGGKKDAEKISILHKDLTKALENDAVYSSIISLSIDGKAEDTIIKDIQRHAAKQIILHMDFLRVSKTTKLQTRSNDTLFDLRSMVTTDMYMRDWCHVEDDGRYVS